MLTIVTLTALAAEPSWHRLDSTRAAAFTVAQVDSSGGMVCARHGSQVACWGDQYRKEGSGWAPPDAMPHRLEGIDDVRDIVVSNGLWLLREHGSVWFVRGDELREVSELAGSTQLEGTDNGVCALNAAGDVKCTRGAVTPWSDAKPEVEQVFRGQVGLSCDRGSCCGWSAEGELTCIGSTSALGIKDKPRKPPVQASGVSGVSLHHRIGCAHTPKGTVCWGHTDQSPFAELADELRQAERVAPGDWDVCWLRDGTLTCSDGKERFELPAADVHRGAHVSCAFTDEGALSCWGTNEYGSLGDGNPLQRLDPVEVRGVRAQALSAGWGETCALHDGKLSCWGAGGPVTDVGPVGHLVAAQYRAACARTGSSVKCWLGHRGDWDDEASFVPMPFDVRDAALDRAGNLCTVDAKGSVHCLYSLGEGGQDGTPRPMKLSEPITALTPMSTGFAFLAENGTVYTWTDARFEGDPDFVDVPGSVQRASATSIAMAVQISGHQNGVCARTKAGPVRCVGPLGWFAGSDKAWTVPGLDGASQISTSNFHVCGVVEGQVRCFGDGEFGKLGTSTADAKDAARPVNLPGPAVEVSAGHDHTCARLGDGRVFCWGSDARGELGTGRPLYTKRPIPTVLGTSGGQSR